MKKIRLLSVLMLALLAVSGCALFAKKADVYITVKTDDANAALITVKFLEGNVNEGSYPNEYSSNMGTVSASGYSWYRYEVPAGAYYVYIEWTGGSRINGRAAITIDPDSASDQWAAVYPDASGNSWGETGGGAFAPLLIHWP